VLPGFHAAQNLLLPVLRQTVEALKSLLEFLLSFGRQLAELRITLKIPLLLV
jgi:hypothetical protein